MKKLQKLNKTRFLLRLKKFFIYELWQHILIFSVLSLCAWLSSKYLEALLFLIAHFVIRGVCDKQFHCNNTISCLAFTITVISVSLIVILPINISLLATIPLVLFITYFGYLLQDYLEHKVKSIYAMSKDEFYKHCCSRGLDDVEYKIAYYVVIERLKGQELYNAIGYSERQTIRKRKEILSKIK